MSEAGSRSHRAQSPAPHSNPKAPASSATEATAPKAAGAEAEPKPAGAKDRREAERAAKPNADVDLDLDEAGSEPPGEQTAAPSIVQELEAKLAERDARLEATLGQYKEALEEFARVKVRLSRDVKKEVQAGKRNFITPLLDVLDNLERALEAALADPQQARTSLCEGVTMVRDQFHAKLAAHGVKKLEALGQPFDPLHFEAVSTVPTSDPKQDGQVIGVMRDAYLLDEETLRHGIVAVGKHGGAA